jgi:hypothetical protein
MSVPTEVLQSGPAHFNQTGQFLYYPLHKSSGVIRQELAQKLVKHAEDRAKELGISALIHDWKVCVGTLDGNAPSDDRSYYVEWKNEQGTAISVVGILIQNGCPVLDHGLEIETN